MHTSHLRRRPCLNRLRLFGEASNLDKRFTPFWRSADSKNSNIIGLHSSVSTTAQLLVRELVHHVWFNNLPIYDLGFTKKKLLDRPFLT